VQFPFTAAAVISGKNSGNAGGVQTEHSAMSRTSATVEIFHFYPLLLSQPYPET
jgi:hypothetical protein